MSVLVLNASDIARLVRTVGVHSLMDQMIERVHGTLLDASSGEYDLRARAGFAHHVVQPGVLEWMPVMHGGSRATIKVVSYNPANPAHRNFPTVMATVSIYEMQTGRLLALADGVVLTALRTGAASAVASRILAQPDSQVLGIVGCGMQAVTQAHALARTHPVKQVLGYDTDPAVARTFAERLAFLGLDVQVVPLDELERRADIICTATSAAVGEGPVLRGLEMQPHVHINAVGSDLPGKIEVPLDVLRRSLVCPDFLPQAVVEGECQQLEESEIGPGLIELVHSAAEFEEWRARPTVFDSTGFALEDHAAAMLLVELAQELGLGTQLELENYPEDARDPYSAPVGLAARPSLQVFPAAPVAEPAAAGV